MIFTDDDLKRLKDEFAKPNWELIEQMLPNKLFALVARLEAAEALKPYWEYYEPVNDEDGENHIAAVNKWREAAGE